MNRCQHYMAGLVGNKTSDVAERLLLEWMGCRLAASSVINALGLGVTNAPQVVRAIIQAENLSGFQSCVGAGAAAYTMAQDYLRAGGQDGEVRRWYEGMRTVLGKYGE